MSQYRHSNRNSPKMHSTRAARECLTFEAFYDSVWRQQLRAFGLTEEWFLAFGRPYTGYGVVRNIPKDRRLSALSEIQKRLVTPLFNDKRFRYEDIQYLAVWLNKEGLGNGRPIALLSKLAFLVKPGRFPLYDRNARAALAARGFRGLEGFYPGFAENFDRAYEREKGKVARTCSQKNIRQHSKNVGLAESVLEREEFQRRVFDWQLWLEGGGAENDEIQPPIRG